MLLCHKKSKKIKKNYIPLANQSIYSDTLATKDFLQMKSGWKCKECHKKNAMPGRGLRADT